jgi:hypothetical protein
MAQSCLKREFALDKLMTSGTTHIATDEGWLFSPS